MNILKFISVNKKRIIGTSLLMSLFIAQTVGAAPTVTGELVSKGNIEYDADNDGKADVYFYSKDLTNIANGIDTLNSDISIMETAMTSLSNQTKTYKTDIINGLNSSVYAKANISSDASFEQIIEKINNIPAPTTAVGTYSTGGDNTGLGVGLSSSTPQADVNIDGVTTLNLGIDEAITLPSGYYPNDITIKNNVANRGSNYLLLTATQKSISLEPGWYDENTVITTNIEPAMGNATYEYVHHIHTEDGITDTTIVNDKANSSSVSSKPTYLSSPKGCYTKAVSVNKYHPTWKQYSGHRYGATYTCPYCGQTVSAVNKLGDGGDAEGWDYAALCGGYAYNVYYPDCGYDNGEVTDIKIHFEK